MGAQLLQMHEVAAECKEFLARTRQQRYPTVLKPIPSRPNFGAVGGGEGFLMAAAAAALAWRNAWVRMRSGRLTSPKLGIVSPTRYYCSGLEPAPAHGVSDPICGGPGSYRQPSVIINHSGGRRIVRSSDVERRGP